MTLTRDEKWLLEEKYDGVRTPEFAADCKRLAAGEPLGYVIGWVPFLGCKIWLDSHPLIPRPETEYWTEKAIEALQARRAASETPLCVLDLCAGSGCIGVAIAKAIPTIHVTFGELEKSHLPTIAKNLTENSIDCTRYQVFQSDLFTQITGTYDFIVSNPPYIDPQLDRTEQSVTSHEPHSALYGGTGGLDLIHTIISEARQHLTECGELWIEHEPEQSTEIQRLASTKHMAAHTHTDQYNRERYTTLVVQ